MVQIVNYPHITSNPGILSGIPIIEGTRTPVRSIVGYFNMGMNAEEILYGLSHLTAAQVYSALAYYFDHKEEIDRDISENNDTSRWKALTDPATHKG